MVFVCILIGAMVVELECLWRKKKKSVEREGVFWEAGFHPLPMPPPPFSLSREFGLRSCSISHFPTFLD